MKGLGVFWPAWLRCWEMQSKEAVKHSLCTGSINSHEWCLAPPRLRTGRFQVTTTVTSCPTSSTAPLALCCTLLGVLTTFCKQDHEITTMYLCCKRPLRIKESCSWACTHTCKQAAWLGLLGQSLRFLPSRVQSTFVALSTVIKRACHVCLHIWAEFWGLVDRRAQKPAQHWKYLSFGWAVGEGNH